MAHSVVVIPVLGVRNGVRGRGSSVIIDVVTITDIKEDMPLETVGTIRLPATCMKSFGSINCILCSEVSPDLLVRVLVELVANYWSWPGGGGVQPHNPRTS